MQDLIGRTFHCLTVTGRDIVFCQWICKCSCGNDAYAKTYDLVNDKKKSCGHLRTEHNKMYADKFLKKDRNMPQVLRTGSSSGWGIDDALDDIVGAGW